MIYYNNEVGAWFKRYDILKAYYLDSTVFKLRDSNQHPSTYMSNTKKISPYTLSRWDK